MKRATTIDDQIELLKNRGIVIKNEEKAKENLLDIGYFRLGFYCFPFEKNYPHKINRTHEYRENTRFETIVQLYYYDVDLRNLLSRYIYRIEINFRTYLIYIVSNLYPDIQTWFADLNVVSDEYIKKFTTKVYTDSFKRNKVINNHHSKYPNDIYAPAWKTLEYMTFGNIIFLYQSLKNEELKIQIAKHYGLTSIKTFCNYLETIRVIRNVCAHSGVLFDLTLAKSIMNGPAGKMEEKKNRMEGAVQVIKYILNIVSKNRADEMSKQLLALKSDCSEEIKAIISDC